MTINFIPNVMWRDVTGDEIEQKRSVGWEPLRSCTEQKHSMYRADKTESLSLLALS